MFVKTTTQGILLGMHCSITKELVRVSKAEKKNVATFERL